MSNVAEDVWFSLHYTCYLSLSCTIDNKNMSLDHLYWGWFGFRKLYCVLHLMGGKIFEDMVSVKETKC